MDLAQGRRGRASEERRRSCDAAGRAGRRRGAGGGASYPAGGARPPGQTRPGGSPRGPGHGDNALPAQEWRNPAHVVDARPGHSQAPVGSPPGSPVQVLRPVLTPGIAPCKIVLDSAHRLPPARCALFHSSPENTSGIARNDGLGTRLTRSGAVRRSLPPARGAPARETVPSPDAARGTGSAALRRAATGLARRAVSVGA